MRALVHDDRRNEAKNDGKKGVLTSTYDHSASILSSLSPFPLFFSLSVSPLSLFLGGQVVGPCYSHYRGGCVGKALSSMSVEGGCVCSLSF